MLQIRHVSCISICNAKYIYPLINIFTSHILMANSKEAQEKKESCVQMFQRLKENGKLQKVKRRYA